MVPFVSRHINARQCIADSSKIELTRGKVTNGGRVGDHKVCEEYKLEAQASAFFVAL